MEISRAHIFPLFWAATAVVFLANPAVSQDVAGWKGRIEKEGDVVIVKNPVKPIYHSGVFSFREELAIGGEEGGDFIFASVESVAVNEDGTIFVLDAKDKNVKVFSMEGKFLRTLGKAGQGPGEFIFPMSLCLMPGENELLVVDARRLSFFKPGGELIREISTVALMPADVRPDSRGNYFIYFINRGAPDPCYELRKVDAGLKDLFSIETSPLPNNAQNGFNPFFPVVRWAPLPDDGVVCGYAVKYELRIHDRQGKLVRKILMDPEPVSIAKEDIDERTEGVPPTLKQNMKIPRYYPAFRLILSDDEGRIFVLAWERPPGRKGYYFDVFDRDGKYIVRIVLPGIKPFFRKDRMYFADENAEGLPLLKRYRIAWKF